MSKTIVLIDDDKVIRDAWESSAREAEILIVAYSAVSDFLKDASLFQKDINIYIDSELEGCQGEVEAKKLFDIGFENLILIKGHAFNRDSSLPSYITKVVSKSTHFLK